MSAELLIHPEKDRLVAFGLGKLAPNEATKIENHLTECALCCETLLDLKDDTFVGLLRDSAGSSSVDESPTAAFSSEATSDRTTLPPELANHPRYQISELLGHGGMGLVFKAEHTLMNRTVALKVIRHKLVRDEAAVQRFRREVQAAARLAHPNIVAAYDAEQAGNTHFLVMEYVDGANLAEVIAPGQPLDIATAIDYVSQIADGLQHAYTKGMVHRDIKPHNLMVNSAGHVKILDFGLATLAMTLGDEAATAPDPHAASSYTTTLGTLMGTPDFISPEQAGDCRTVDIRSDIYSLGCTLYFLLTGQPPFNTGSAIERVKAHIHSEPEPIENVRPGIPPAMAAIIRRMMDKDPAARYQTPAEVAEALVPFTTRGQNSSSHSSAPTPQLQTAPTRWLPRSTTLIAAAFAGSFVLAAAIFILQQGKTTIRFDVEDPNLAISFGDHSATVKDDDRTFTITPGTKQQFVVKQDGKDLETDSFTLDKGQKVALRVKVIDGAVNVAPSDGSVSLSKSEDPSQSVDAWVERLKLLHDHMQTAFVVGPELTLLDPDKGLEIVQKAWPQISVPEVKTGVLKAFDFGKALAPKKHPKLLQILNLGMTDSDPQIKSYAALYLKEFAHEDFSTSDKAYAAWYAQYGSKPIEEVIRLNQSRVAESVSKQLAELENAIRKGNMNLVGDLASKLGEAGAPVAIPTLIGVIDADNSYDTIYNAGYFGLGQITQVKYSPFHDGPWWHRWWEKNKSRYPQEVQAREIPVFPKTANGKKHTPFPEDLDTLKGKLAYFKELKGQPATTISSWAQEVAEHKDPAAIPFFIGVIDADNTYDTVYGVGCIGLGFLTGVHYDQSHDGEWWRNWWEENKSKYPAEVQAVEIPDLHAEFTAIKKQHAATATEDAVKDVADIPNQDLFAGNNKKMRYFLVGAKEGAEAPKSGFKLVIMLPGGDGSADFNPFICRLYKNCLNEEYLVAEPVAFKWTPNQEIVWPTRKSSVEGQKFATEDFVEAIVHDIGAKYQLDTKSIFTLSWSSSGPAAYAIALADKTPVTGSYIAMSIFRPADLPPLANAKGRAFYIEHSPEDQVCSFAMAEEAKATLEKQGAAIEFNTYQGGHGWHGDIFGNVHKGIAWLQDHVAPNSTVSR